MSRTRSIWLRTGPVVATRPAPPWRALVWALLAVACRQPLPADAARLQAYNVQYAGHLKFDIRSEIYLLVRVVDAQEPPQSELESLFLTFAPAAGAPRDTRIVYLILYSPPETFRYQLYWDPQKGSMVRDDEHEWEE